MTQGRWLSPESAADYLDVRVDALPLPRRRQHRLAHQFLAAWHLCGLPRLKRG